MPNNNKKTRGSNLGNQGHQGNPGVGHGNNRGSEDRGNQSQSERGHQGMSDQSSTRRNENVDSGSDRQSGK